VTTRRRSAVDRAVAAAGPRPRRGAPDDTRRRLVLAAAREIEEHGYFATDSNRIARAAGYAAGTFYKHFVDKRAAFLAVYEDWVTAEWTQIGAIVERGDPPDVTAAAIADAVIAHHRAWPRFRASLRALVALDDEVKQAQRGWRRRQLATMSTLRTRGGADDALLLLVAERIGDAIADGEVASLGVREADARAFLIARIAERIAP
jgi:AcrR family transcriptional regulator